MTWYPVVRRYATLDEVRTRWTVADMFEAQAAIEAFDRAQRAAERAMQPPKKGGAL